METQNKQPNNNKIKSYVQYSGLVFQMMGIIGLFTFAGYKLDQNQASKTPIYTAILSLLGVCISLYMVIKSLKKTDFR
ncbi:MAG: AtpZ/AtpI family protein [Sphingobacteriales bacterium]|nr:MAG: AtpZ/AtpI family protein [Sphingobacteriales bacterium]